jgi:hypothetical protein
MVIPTLPTLTSPALRCVPTQYNVVGTTAFPKKSSYRCVSAATGLQAQPAATGIAIGSIGATCGGTRSDPTHCQIALGTDGSLPAPTVLKPPLQCVPTQISAAGLPVTSSYQCVNEVSAASAVVSSTGGLAILSLGSSCGPSYGGSNQCELSMGVSGSLPSPTITKPPLQCVPTRFTLGATPSGSQYKCANALTGEIGPGVYPSES